MVIKPDTFSVYGIDDTCQGEVIDLSVTATAQNIKWTTGESGQAITVDATGTYGVEVSNTANGLTCSEYAEKEVEFLPYPVDPVIEEIKNCFAYKKELEIHIETPAFVVWDNVNNWSFDSTRIVNSIGTYNASLFYYPQCSIQTSVDVEEFCPMTIFVPNAFTPNNDGRNDTFQPKMHNVESYKLYIFDRWGELIFTSSSPTNQWDGTYMGNECQIDVYVYKIIVTGYYKEGDLDEERLVGIVSLLR